MWVGIAIVVAGVIALIALRGPAYRPMSRAQFMAAVRKRVDTHHRGIKIKSRNGFGWDGRTGGRDITLRLDEIYLEYLRDPRQLAQIVDRYLKQVSK